MSVNNVKYVILLCLATSLISIKCTRSSVIPLTTFAPTEVNKHLLETPNSTESDIRENHVSPPQDNFVKDSHVAETLPATLDDNTPLHIETIKLELQVMKFAVIEDQLVMTHPENGIEGYDFDIGQMTTSETLDIMYTLDASGSGYYRTLTHRFDAGGIYSYEYRFTIQECRERKTELTDEEGVDLTPPDLNLGFCILTNSNNFVIGWVTDLSEKEDESQWVELTYEVYR